MIILIRTNLIDEKGAEWIRDFSEEFIGWRDPSKLFKTRDTVQALVQAEPPGNQAAQALAQEEAPGRQAVQALAQAQAPGGQADQALARVTVFSHT